MTGGTRTQFHDRVLCSLYQGAEILDFGQGSTIAIHGTLFMILFMTIYFKDEAGMKMKRTKRIQKAL